MWRPSAVPPPECNDAGVSFFDDVPEPPPLPEPSIPDRKAWMGAPSGWVGGWVPWHIVIAHTPRLYAVITEVAAFPTGVEFALATRTHPEAMADEADFFGPMGMTFMRGDAGGPRLGIGFADGRKAVLGAMRPWSENDPDAPVLMPGGGGGGGSEYRMNFWLWPLPPAGPLRIVTAWEEMGLDEHTVVLDAEDLVAAAGRAEKLWDYDEEAVARAHFRRARRRPMGSGGGMTTSAFLRAPEPDDQGKESET